MAVALVRGVLIKVQSLKDKNHAPAEPTTKSLKIRAFISLNQQTFI